MVARIEVEPADAARIVDALLTAATAEQDPRPSLARRYRALAEQLVDALDELDPDDLGSDQVANED